MTESAMGPCPVDSDLMKAWKAYQATNDFQNTSFWATTSLKTRPERAAEIGLDPTANVATDEDRNRNIQGSLWAAFMAGFGAAGGKVTF